MSMPRLRLVRNVSRASASVFVGNMRSDWKLERSLSNIGPGPCMGVTCEKNWKYPPRSTQSDTRNGTRSTSTSFVVSRTLAIGNDWATVAYSFGQSVAQSFPIASVRDTTNEVLDVVAALV